MQSTRVQTSLRLAAATLLASAALTGCGGDDEPAGEASSGQSSSSQTASGTPQAQKTPSKPPTEGSAAAKAINADTSCKDFLALSSDDRGAAAYYVTTSMNTNQAGFPAWQSIIEEFCERKGGELQSKRTLGDLLENFVNDGGAQYEREKAEATTEQKK